MKGHRLLSAFHVGGGGGARKLVKLVWRQKLKLTVPGAARYLSDVCCALEGPSASVPPPKVTALCYLELSAPVPRPLSWSYMQSCDLSDECIVDQLGFGTFLMAGRSLLPASEAAL